MSITPIIAGCDISLKTLDICLLQGDRQRHFSLPNTAAGHAELLAVLIEKPIEIFVLEASGGYETALFSVLQGAEIPVIRLLAQRARQFARADGQLAKTDRPKPTGLMLAFWPCSANGCVLSLIRLLIKTSAISKRQPRVGGFLWPGVSPRAASLSKRHLPIFAR